MHSGPVAELDVAPFAAIVAVVIAVEAAAAAAVVSPVPVPGPRAGAASASQDLTADTSVAVDAVRQTGPSPWTVGL